MAYFKLLNTSNKKVFRMPLLLFMVLLSGHLSGNELPAPLKSEQITRLEINQQRVIQYRNLLAIDQKQFHPILESRVNQAFKKQGNIMTLPQTGMASDLYKKIGFWILLFAVIFWIIERHFIHIKRYNQGWEDEWNY